MNIQAIKTMIKPLSAMIPGFSMEKIIPQITEGIMALEAKIGAKPYIVLTVENNIPVITVYRQSEKGGLDIAIRPYQINSMDDIFKIFENLSNNINSTDDIFKIFENFSNNQNDANTQPAAPRLAATEPTDPTGPAKPDTDDTTAAGFDYRAENIAAFE